MTYVECNVGSKAAVDAAIEICAASGRIDVLANVAGIVQFGRIETVTEDEWDRVHAVDLKGPFFLIQAALPHIRAAKGNIVNVSSVAGNAPQPYATAYAAAKGGLTQLTRALALELSPEGIRVNVICPGTVDTPIVEQVFHKLTDDLDTRVADRLMMMLPGGAIKPVRDRRDRRLARLAGRADDHRRRDRARRRHELSSPARPVACGLAVGSRRRRRCSSVGRAPLL